MSYFQVFHLIQLATLSIPYPEAVFSIEFFKKYPEPFYKVLSRFLYSEYHPTLAHFFIRLLHEKQLLLRHYTQNVDGLEFLTEIPEDLVVQAHGTLFEIHCIECGRRFPFSVFRKVLKENFQWLRCSTLNQFVRDGFKSNAEFIPGQVQQNGTTLAHRDRCMGYVKPNIVFFGEQLPPRFFEMVPQDFVKADLLLILGTSATVQPFAQLIDMVPNHCPRLLINKEVVGISPNDNSLFQFHNANNYRDVFFQGDCDDGVQRLCSLCGWENDLKRLQSSYVKLRGELYWKKLEALKS